MNIGRESLVVSFWTQDQLDEEPTKEARSWFAELSTSSNMQWLCSLQMHHIKHNGVKFQYQMRVSPANSTIQKEDLAYFLVKPKKANAIIMRVCT